MCGNRKLGCADCSLDNCFVLQNDFSAVCEMSYVKIENFWDGEFDFDLRR